MPNDFSYILPLHPIHPLLLAFSRPPSRWRVPYKLHQYIQIPLKVRDIGVHIPRTHLHNPLDNRLLVVFWKFKRDYLPLLPPTRPSDLLFKIILIRIRTCALKLHILRIRALVGFKLPHEFPDHKRKTLAVHHSDNEFQRAVTDRDIRVVDAVEDDILMLRDQMCVRDHQLRER